MFPRKKKLFLVLIFVLLVAAAPGCGQKPGAAPGPGGKKPAASGTEQTKPGPEQKAVPVTVYFADKQAMYLVPEERQVIVDQGTIAEAVIKELIKGPQNPELRKTIPEGTVLLSLTVKDGTAYVNFSKEFQSRHWGGTAGESMTIFSVVNSLGKLKDIKQVQFLLEGQKQESILGHADTSAPISPNWNMVAK
ncbi:MAG: GerMN domain-containing protein [Bacillota bacterium]